MIALSLSQYIREMYGIAKGRSLWGESQYPFAIVDINAVIGPYLHWHRMRPLRLVPQTLRLPPDPDVRARIISCLWGTESVLSTIPDHPIPTYLVGSVSTSWSWSQAIPPLGSAHLLRTTHPSNIELDIRPFLAIRVPVVAVVPARYLPMVDIQYTDPAADVPPAPPLEELMDLQITAGAPLTVLPEQSLEERILSLTGTDEIRKQLFAEHGAFLAYYDQHGQPLSPLFHSSYDGLFIPPPIPWVMRQSERTVLHGMVLLATALQNSLPVWPVHPAIPNDTNKVYRLHAVSTVLLMLQALVHRHGEPVLAELEAELNRILKPYDSVERMIESLTYLPYWSEYPYPLPDGFQRTRLPAPFRNLGRFLWTSPLPIHGAISTRCIRSRSRSGISAIVEVLLSPRLRYLIQAQHALQRLL